MENERSVESGFADLGLRTELLKALSGLGYEEPTPIQREAIPHLVAGKDLLGQAATGTGKTAAFALPILQLLDPNEDRPSPVALVLVPTRELAMQVSEAVYKYGHDLRARCVPIYGGQPIGRQIDALRRGCHVVVATPGRALDHIRKNTLELDGIAMVVLDEADEMLDMGFAEDLEAILEATPKERQTVLFSATMPPRIDAIARRHQRNPVRVTIERSTSQSGTSPLVKQTAYLIPRHHKAAALGRILDIEAPEAAIVFCRTRGEVDQLTETLNGRGYRAEALHGGMDQEQRDRVMGRVRAGTADLLIATDVAARGLDVEHVTHVVHYDLPESAETWVHRTGRTGRAGREGTAIALVTPRERRRIANLQAAIGRTIDARPLPTAEALRAVRLERLREQVDGVDAERDAEALTALRAMVAAHGGDPVDLAARALRVLLAQQEAPGDTSDLGAGEAPRTSRYDGPWTRLRLSVGRADKVLPGDLFRLLVDRAGVPKGRVGAIKIGVRGSSADVPPECVDGVVDALRGVVWGRRPVQVQVERSSG